MEKLALIERFNEQEKQAFYAVLNDFIGKQKLKDALNEVLDQVV